MKIKKFLEGFKLIDYKFNLQTEPNFCVINEKVKDDLSIICKKIESFHIYNLEFRILNSEIVKCYDSELLNLLEILEDCVSFVKICTQSSDQTSRKEITINIVIYCRGIDYHLWKMEFKCSFVFDSVENCFHNIAPLCVEFVKTAFIDGYSLQNMSFNKLVICDINDSNNSGNRVFKNEIMTFSNGYDGQPNLISDILPSLSENDARSFEQKIYNSDTDSDNNLIFSIIRKRGN